MRTKEFIIFLVIFTVVYIVFFVALDKMSASLLQQKIKRRAFSLINVSSFILFAQFYGLNGTADKNILDSIYLSYKDEQKIPLSSAAQMYNITPFEFAVIYLYMEYINVFNKKMINFDAGMICPISFDDFPIITKYESYFHNHADFRSIYSAVGETARQNLSYLDHRFLVPGVRFIDDVLYYVGDINEKS